MLRSPLLAATLAVGIEVPGAAAKGVTYIYTLTASVVYATPVLRRHYVFIGN
jgi:hypothetical protein